MAKTSYAIALGSNRMHGRHGRPSYVLAAAVMTVRELGVVDAVSSVRTTQAIGPAGRAFANAALLLRTDLPPPDVLKALKTIEHRFGRRAGRRWGPRVLDLDIILWSGGSWSGPGPVIPHPPFRTRSFALQPLAEIAPDWRDPLTGLTVRQLLARLRRPIPVDPARPRS